MGITFINFGGLFAPLQQFIGWLTTAPQRAPAREVRPQALQAVALTTRPALKPLRVVRVVDGCRPGAGRMVISGRMADVCAELDRLAALEAERG